MNPKMKSSSLNFHYIFSRCSLSYKLIADLIVSSDAFNFYKNLCLFQVLEVKSPIKQNKSEKQIKNGDCDKVNENEVTVE